MSPFRGQLSGRPLPACIYASHGAETKVQGGGRKLNLRSRWFLGYRARTRRRKSIGGPRWSPYRDIRWKAGGGTSRTSSLVSPKWTRRKGRWSSLRCGLGFGQFRCTRPPKLVVWRRRSRPRGPTAFLQVVALLPIGRDFLQSRQVCLRIGILHELLHADRREDRHDCGASLLGSKFVGGCAGDPPAPRKSDDHRRDRADCHSL
jgi:hypothetical protein